MAKRSDWITHNYPYELGENSIGFDYITFSFLTETVLNNFLTRIESFLKIKVVVHYFDVYRKLTTKVEKGTTYAIYDSNLNMGKGRRYFLSFPGEGCQAVFSVLFEPQLVEYMKKGSVELKRIDIRIDTRTSVNYQVSAIKKTIYEYYTSFLAEQRKMEEQTNKNRLLRYTSSNEEGEIIYIEPKQLNSRVRIYTAQSNTENVRCELELRTAKLKELQKLWAKSDSKKFLQIILSLLDKQVDLIAFSDLTKNLVKIGKKQIKHWILNLKLANKASILNIKVKNNKEEEFLLQDKSFYPVYLAIFQKSCTQLKLSEPDFQNNKSNSNIIYLHITFKKLLEVIGWPQTRHYERKLVSGLISLEAISFVIESKKDRSFSSLITNSFIDKTNRYTNLSINLSVFYDLSDTIALEETFYKTSVENYTSFFKKSSSQLPSFFYPLLAQSYTSLNRHVVYSGTIPRNAESINHLEKVLMWLFQTDYLKRDFIKKPAIVQSYSRTTIIYSTEVGSLQINIQRNRIAKCKIN